MPDRLLHVRTGRHPHEILVLLATVLVGVVGTVLPSEVSQAVAETLDGWLGRAYYVGLAAFSSIALWGIFRRRIEGLLVERVAITVVALYYAVFAACVFWYYGLGGAMGAVIPTAYCIANLARCWQIKTDLALLKSYLRDHPGEVVR